MLQSMAGGHHTVSNPGTHQALVGAGDGFLVRPLRQPQHFKCLCLLPRVARLLRGGGLLRLLCALRGCLIAPPPLRLCARPCLRLEVWVGEK